MADPASHPTIRPSADEAFKYMTADQARLALRALLAADYISEEIAWRAVHLARGICPPQREAALREMVNVRRRR